MFAYTMSTCCGHLSIAFIKSTATIIAHEDSTPNFINFHPELDGNNSPRKFSTLQLLNDKLKHDGD